MITGVRIAHRLAPLAVSSTNPRYFSAAAAPEEAVYLTGSHVNNNFHDGWVWAAIVRKTQSGSTLTRT
jgi:hypothetical protein